MTTGQLLTLAMFGAMLGVWLGHVVAYRVTRWALSPRRGRIGAGATRMRGRW